MRCRLVALVLFACAACGVDSHERVDCVTDTDCVTVAGPILAGDASIDLLPRCCSGVCVLPGFGCDSGLRYLTDRPLAGSCTVDVMCPPANLDMSMPPPVDLSSSD
jgi:hypothetical protein